jgi:protein gp37
MPSRIEWTTETWNPTVGCDKISPGCKNCYAIREARRAAYNPKLAHIYQDVVTPKGEPLNWTGEVKLIPERLELPLRWRRPRRVFVNSMSDLFHEALPDEAIDRVFAVMALCPQHTFQVLTKRAERMQAYLLSTTTVGRFFALCAQVVDGIGTVKAVHHGDGFHGLKVPNVWLGVSCEDQKTADERIPWLLKTPAAVRFLSLEPLLGPVDLDKVFWRERCHNCQECAGNYPRDHGIDWVIVGGESGPGARPCNVQWIRDVVRQCREASVPCFVKQMGSAAIVEACRQQHFEWGEGNFEYWGDERSGLWRVTLRDRKGGDPAEWPKELRVRQMPEVRR